MFLEGGKPRLEGMLNRHGTQHPVLGARVAGSYRRLCLIQSFAEFRSKLLIVHLGVVLNRGRARLGRVHGVPGLSHDLRICSNNIQLLLLQMLIIKGL